MIKQSPKQQKPPQLLAPWQFLFILSILLRWMQNERRAAVADVDVFRQYFR
jgi:hypothetical protein